VKSATHPQRRSLFGLLLAAVLTLAAFGMMRDDAQADASQNERVLLPIITRGVGGSTIPLP
jgi:hypothetical protein